MCALRTTVRPSSTGLGDVLSGSTRLGRVRPGYFLCWSAGQRSTGMRGYFGKRSSLFERRHIENTLPRPVRISF